MRDLQNVANEIEYVKFSVRCQRTDLSMASRDVCSRFPTRRDLLVTHRRATKLPTEYCIFRSVHLLNTQDIYPFYGFTAV
jgi:hypothetical protein